MFFVKEAVRKCVFLALGSSIATARRISRIAELGKNIILNLHRVAEADGSTYRPLNPKLFKELLAFLQKGCDVVPLDALSERGTRPKVVLSFDDGYWEPSAKRQKREIPHAARRSHDRLPPSPGVEQHAVRVRREVSRLSASAG